MSSSRTSPQTIPTADEMDRLRAHAMNMAADPEGARFRAGVATERAAGIPPERFIGRAELAVRRRAVRQG